MAEKEICKWYGVCPIRGFVERGKLAKRWVEDYCFRGGKNCKRYEMEEKGIYHPDNMLPDGTINKNLEAIENKIGWKWSSPAKTAPFFH